MHKAPKAAAKAVKPKVSATATDPVSAGKKQRGAPAFAPGQSGNPNGRPKGSRNKLGEAFLEALHSDFEQHGIRAIQRTRTEDPAAYVRVIAGILPKELKIETTSDLTDEQLDARIRQLASVLEIGVSGSSGGTSAPAQPDQASPLPTLQ